MEPASLLLSLFFTAYASVVVVGGFLVWKHRRAFRQALEPSLPSAWKSAAQRLRLTQIETGRTPDHLPCLTATSGKLSIRLDKVPRGTLAATRIQIRGLGYGDEPLEVLRETDELGAGRRLFERQVEIGAEEFDREFRIVGSFPLALAVLDADVRPVLAELLRGSLPVKGHPTLSAQVALRAGKLTVSVAHPTTIRQKDLPDQVLAALDSVLHLAQRLAQPEDLAARLAGNLLEETEVSVRLNCLRLLIREHRAHPATHEALTVAQDDPAPEVRCEAAVASGKEGHETLRRLVKSNSGPEDLAVRAVTALGVFLSIEEAAQLLENMVRWRRPEVAGALLETITRHGRLGRRGTAELEALLVTTLHEAVPKLALAAAKALGAMGSVAAVPALAALEETGSRELARAARQAIAEIQARLHGAERGQLSLAGSEAGALSLAGDDAAGRLSLPEEGRGAQSQLRKPS